MLSNCIKNYNNVSYELDKNRFSSVLTIIQENTYKYLFNLNIYKKNNYKKEYLFNSL